jgi:hypothetical protein
MVYGAAAGFVPASCPGKWEHLPEGFLQALISATFDLAQEITVLLKP